jgi:hypothetical protein
MARIRFRWRSQQKSSEIEQRLEELPSFKELKPKAAQRIRYLERTSHSLYLLTLLILVFFLALLTFHFSTVQDLRAKQESTLAELSATQQELARYKEAYAIVLQDAQAFGRIYDITYRGMNESENGTNATPLPGANVWEYYHERGVINDSCIPTTKVVQTPSDVVELVLVASGQKQAAWPRLTLLVDGSFLASYQIESEQQTIHRTLLALPKGEHHLDFVYDNAGRAGNVTVSLLRIGDRTIENAVSVIDEGQGFAMFDCKETREGGTMTTDGAMRFRIEKL